MTDIKSEMLWEVGNIYKTRSGKDVVIYAILPNQYSAIHGAICEDGEWEMQTWKLNGQYHLTNPTSSYDLMPPEPETHVAYLNIYNKQAGGFHSTRKKADKNAEEGRTARLRIEWKDGQYDE